MNMDYVEIKGLDGTLIEAYYICRSCGYVGWASLDGDIRCVNEILFGECKPRNEVKKMTRKGKYRKHPNTQTTLYGSNLDKAFWGIYDRVGEWEI